MPRHRPRPRTRALLPLAALCAALGSLSNPLLADEAVNDSARQFLEQRLLEQGLQGSVEIAASSARMPACSEPQPFLPRSGQRLLGRVAVGVRCADGQTRYLQAQIGVVGDYVVAARAIAAGETLSADMLEVRQGALERLPRQLISDPLSVVGMQTTRDLDAGSLLQSRSLRAALLVERNARVSVEALGTGFRISRDGVALDAGALGSEIRVRTDGGEILRARIVGRNRLQVAQ